MRRLLEFIFLIKAIFAFFILVYIHVTFSRTPATCLDHIKNDWPRDGILRYINFLIIFLGCTYVYNTIYF